MSPLDGDGARDDGGFCAGDGSADSADSCDGVGVADSRGALGDAEDADGAGLAAADGFADSAAVPDDGDAWALACTGSVPDASPVEPPFPLLQPTINAVNSTAIPASNLFLLNSLAS